MEGEYGDEWAAADAGEQPIEEWSEAAATRPEGGAVQSDAVVSLAGRTYTGTDLAALLDGALPDVVAAWVSVDPELVAGAGPDDGGQAGATSAGDGGAWS